MRLLSIAWRLASRELRGGELGALIAALLVATAALTAVGAFAERVEGGLKASANELLGGDLRRLSGQGSYLYVRSRVLGRAKAVAQESRLESDIAGVGI